MVQVAQIGGRGEGEVIRAMPERKHLFFQEGFPYYVLSIVSSSQLSGHGIPVRSQPQFDSALTLVTHCIALLPRGVGGHVTPRFGFVLLVFVFCSYFYPLCITVASARGQITPHIGLRQILIPKK